MWEKTAQSIKSKFRFIDSLKTKFRTNVAYCFNVAVGLNRSAAFRFFFFSSLHHLRSVMGTVTSDLSHVE